MRRSNLVHISSETYFQAARVENLKLYATISNFPCGSNHWRTEWILIESQDEYVIIGADSKNSEHEYYVRLEKKEVEEQ